MGHFGVKIVHFRELGPQPLKNMKKTLTRPCISRARGALLGAILVTIGALGLPGPLFFRGRFFDVFLNRCFGRVGSKSGFSVIAMLLGTPLKFDVLKNSFRNQFWRPPGSILEGLRLNFRMIFVCFCRELAENLARICRDLPRLLESCLSSFSFSGLPGRAANFHGGWGGGGPPLGVVY